MSSETSIREKRIPLSIPQARAAALETFSNKVKHTNINSVPNRVTDKGVDDLRGLSYHLKTVFLFTCSDLKTIVIPSTFFALVCILSGPVFQNLYHPPLVDLIRRTILTVAWIWLNLLPFTIENQRQPESILEDKQNNPWRPLPSQRLTRDEAFVFMLLGYILALSYSAIFGAIVQSLALVGLGYWYNNMGGADSSPLIRHVVNALGYISFGSGALEVISARALDVGDGSACKWLGLIGAVVATTIQAQDMSDQAGDRLRKRRTIPLVLGDDVARWTIAVPVVIWSVLCPSYWKLPLGAYFMPFLLGLTVATRFLEKNESAQQDRTSFKWYNTWIVSLYLLPLFKRYEGIW